MKKYLPLVIFIIGLVVFAGLYFFVIRNKREEIPVEEEEIVAEIPFEKRPFVSLIPTADGHYLNFKVENIKLEAISMDYELLYTVGDGRTQGVPGTIKLEGTSEIERQLLLGSESSGKFRYDEGVENGTITLRFRDQKGKLLGKLSTQFHLQTNVESLSSLDGKFSFTLTRGEENYFVIMETFGLPPGASQPSNKVTSGPYGVFSSDEASGEVKLDGEVNYWNGSSWQKVESGKAYDAGVFVGLGNAS
jgi:hypothetical protein